MEFALYLLLGSVAGVLAGLFGVGGGLIIVPVLVFSFSAQGFAPEILTHLAVGTSLATISISLAHPWYSRRCGCWWTHCGTD